MRIHLCKMSLKKRGLNRAYILSDG